MSCPPWLSVISNFTSCQIKASASASVYLVVSQQIVCLPQSLGRLICRLPPSRDHSDSPRPTLLQTPGQRSADKTTQGYVIVSRRSAELHKRVVILPPPHPHTPRAGLSPAAVASPVAPCTTCPSRQDSFSAPPLSSQSQFLCGSKEEMSSAPVFSLKTNIISVPMLCAFTKTVKSEFTLWFWQFLNVIQMSVLLYHPIKFKNKHYLDRKAAYFTVISASCILPLSSITYSELYFKL